MIAVVSPMKSTSRRLYHLYISLIASHTDAIPIIFLTAGFDVVYPSLWWPASGPLSWYPSFKGDLGITVI